MHFVDILHVLKSQGIEICPSFSASGYNPFHKGNAQVASNKSIIEPILRIGHKGVPLVLENVSLLDGW
jgi:hypothetical protein